jgi:hypothetical protein
MENIFTLNPKWGDAAVGDLWTGEKKYITAESFDPSKLSSTSYEIAGAVCGRIGSKGVLTAYKKDVGSWKWCARYEWLLTGYTLDGTDRTGVFSFRTSTADTANTDVTVTYNASDTASFVSQLSTAFAAQTSMAKDNWFAFLADDGSVHVQWDYWGWQQTSYNSAKGDFSVSGALLPDVSYHNRLLAKNGTAMAYPVLNPERALAYFKSDNSSTAYNPSSNADKTYVYPICKPGYLGTSAYQSDHCAALRAVYGEGEEGWLRYMKAVEVLIPCDRYMAGFRDGLDRTELLAAKTYTLADGSSNILCPAAYHALNDPSTSVFGGWHLGTVEENTLLLKSVKYGTDGSRTADLLNRTLWAMDGDAVSNGSGLWSCARSYAYGAWFFYGHFGFWNRDSMCYGFGVRPLSLNYLP